MNTKVIQIPDTINDIRITDFYKIIKLEETVEQKDFIFFVKVFCIIADLDFEYVRDNVSISSLKPSIEALTEMFKTQLNDTALEYFEIDGEKYYLQDTEDLLTGEYIDIESFVIGGMYENIAAIASILYRKDGEVYNSKTKKQKIKLFNENLTIGQLYGSLLFFCSGEKKK